MNAMLSLFDPLRAVLLREFRAALINRYFQIFAGLALLGGFTAAFFSEDPNAVAFLIVQMALYLVSLFALLAGVSSAQGERSEWQLMFAQPVPRVSYPVAKFIAYLSIFATVLLLVFVPAAFASAHLQMIGLLYAQTLLLAAVFLAVGLVAGVLASDRAHALIIGVSAWLFLLVGVDLVGLVAARIELVQKIPDVWISLLMLNPLDAFRINALFALEQIPAEAASKTALASWWIAHAGIWFEFIAIVWSGVLITLAGFRLSRIEE
jgi:ABC-2 type transport system permease protein/Cu-processing system permease protein